MSGTGRKWTQDEIEFDWDKDATEHPFVTIIAKTPVGELYLMGDYSDDGRKITLRGVHTNGNFNIRSKDVGQPNLRVTAQQLLYLLDRHELEVHGSTRTTGARPGHVPIPFRFRRRGMDAPG